MSNYLTFSSSHLRDYANGPTIVRMGAGHLFPVKEEGNSKWWLSTSNSSVLATASSQHFHQKACKSQHNLPATQLKADLSTGSRMACQHHQTQRFWDPLVVWCEPRFHHGRHIYRRDDCLVNLNIVHIAHIVGQPKARVKCVSLKRSTSGLNWMRNSESSGSQDESIGIPEDNG